MSIMPVSEHDGEMYAPLTERERSMVQALADRQTEVERLRGLLTDTYLAWARKHGLSVGRLQEVERVVNEVRRDAS